MGLSRGSNALPAMLMGMTGGRGGGGGMGAGGMGAGSMDFSSMIKTGGGQGAQGGRSGQKGQGGSSGKGGRGGQAGNNQHRTQSEDRSNMSGTSPSGSILDTISNAVADMIIPDAKTDIAPTAQVASEPEVLQAEVSKKAESTVQSVVMESEGGAEGMHEDSTTLLNQKNQTDQADPAGQKNLADQIDQEDQIEAEDPHAKKIELKEPDAEQTKKAVNCKGYSIGI